MEVNKWKSGSRERGKIRVREHQIRVREKGENQERQPSSTAIRLRNCALFVGELRLQAMWTIGASTRVVHCKYLCSVVSFAVGFIVLLLIVSKVSLFGWFVVCVVAFDSGVC